MKHCFPYRQIGDVVSDVITWNPVRDGHNQLIRYIDLSSIDQNTKVIHPNEPIVAREAPSRARQLVQVGDILVSTVRPNLNGVATVDEGLDGATASTGFCVLRPNKRELDEAYLFHWVKTPEFVSDMVRKSTGASYPAVSDRIILESKIPLPPIAQQKRIAAILDRAEELRSLRRQALGALDAIVQSIFIEMFGGSAKRFDIVKIEDVADKSKYSLSSGPFGSNLTSKHYVERGVPILRGLNVTSDRLSLEHLKFLSESKAKELSRSEVKPGDVVIVAVGSSGLAYEIPESLPRAIMSQNFNKITPDSKKVDKTYLTYCFNSLTTQDQVKQKTTDTVRTFFSLTKLKTIQIPLPPLPLQKEFTRRIEAIEQLKATHRESLAHLDALFASLQHRAFRGELSP